MERQRSGEQGYMLVAVMLLCLLILLGLSVAAPTVARRLQRERDEATVSRAKQYVRAIQLYYRKFGHYPVSIDQLENTNNMRFLRHRYVDPLTGKDDWRLIHVGENKTQVKGFFGEPLMGLPGSGLGGSAPGSSTSSASGGGLSGGLAGLGAALLGGGGSSTGGGTSGATSAPGTSTNTGAAGANGATGTTGSTGSSSNAGSGSGFGAGGVGMIMGVGVNHPGDSIVAVNGENTYNTWEFLYDPRSEPKPNLGGGVGSSNAGNLGGNNTTNPITSAPSGGNNSGPGGAKQP